MTPSLVHLVCTRENGPHSGDYFDEYEWTPTGAFWDKDKADHYAIQVGGVVISLEVKG